MRLSLSWAMPNKILADIQSRGTAPDEHLAFLACLWVRDHPVQRRFRQHLGFHPGGLSMTFNEATKKYEIEYQSGSLGEAAWVFYNALQDFANELEDSYSSLALRNAHNFIDDVVVDFRPKDLVTFWLGGIAPEDRLVVRDYLERLDAR